MEANQEIIPSPIDYFASLPREIREFIFSFLDNKSAFNFRQSCHAFDLLSRKFFLTILASDRIVKIECGESVSFLLKTNGELYGMGGEDSLRDGQVVLTRIAGVKDIIHISRREYHALAVSKDGNIYSWGNNKDGQLGLGHYDYQHTPQWISTLNNIVCASTGNYHSLALDKNGYVYAWGENDQGQLGFGHNSRVHSVTNLPIKILDCSNVKFIAAGRQHSIALSADGTVYAWGGNQFGQLGLGYNNQCNSPQKVPDLEGIVSIVAGKRFTLALRKDGTLFAWGHNEFGQLGLGHTKDSNIPQEVIVKNVLSIAAGDFHGLAVTTNGLLYSWGNNRSGQLGLGQTKDSEVPQVVTGITGLVVDIAAGGFHSMALTKDNRLYSWGGNDMGQLGFKESVFIPTQVPEVLYKNKVKMLENLQKIANSFQERDVKSLQTVSSQTKLVLSKRLDEQSFFSAVQSLFFAPTQEKKLRNGLKEFISLKENLSVIENEIEMYKTLNSKNKGSDKAAFNFCLNKLTEILNKEKKHHNKLKALQASLNKEISDTVSSLTMSYS